MPQSGVSGEDYCWLYLMDIFIGSFIGTLIVAIILYVVLKNQYITVEPALKDKNIDAVFALPALQWWSATATFLFLLVFLPEKYNLVEYLASDLAKLEVSEETYASLYNCRTVFGFLTAGFFVYFCIIIVGLYRRAKFPMATMKILTSGASFFAAMTLVYSFITFSSIFTKGSSDAYFVLSIALPFIIPIALFGYLQWLFNKAIERVYKFGEHDNLPLMGKLESGRTNTPQPTNNNTGNGETKQMSSKTEQLFKLKELLDGGILTQEEFDNEKKKILNS